MTCTKTTLLERITEDIDLDRLQADDTGILVQNSEITANTKGYLTRAKTRRVLCQ